MYSVEYQFGKMLFLCRIKLIYTSYNLLSYRGLEIEDVNFAKQIVGFEPATKAAFTKIDRMRSRHSISGPVIAVQNFVAEISEEK